MAKKSTWPHWSLWHSGFAEAWSRGPESVFFYRAGNPHPREPIELWESWCKYIDFHEAWPDDFSTDDWKELLPPAWRKHIDSYEQALSESSRKTYIERGVPRVGFMSVKKITLFLFICPAALPLKSIYHCSGQAAQVNLRHIDLWQRRCRSRQSTIAAARPLKSIHDILIYGHGHAAQVIP